MLSELAKVGAVTHVFFCAYQYTGSFAEDASVNFDLFRNLIQAVERSSKTLKHVFFMSGTKWYGECPENVSHETALVHISVPWFHTAVKTLLVHCRAQVRSVLYFQGTALGHSRRPVRKTTREPLRPVCTIRWKTFASSAKQKGLLGPGLPSGQTQSAASALAAQ